MKIENVAVLGAGVMGSQIAQVLALKGCQVALQDLSDDCVQRGMAGIEKNLQRFFVAKGKLTEEEAREVMGHLRPCTTLEQAVPEVDMVIESVFEDLDLKKEIFSQLSQLCRPDTLLATNTSALSISDIASVVQGPERVIGMHFFNPVAVMKLVEIVMGARTSDATLALTQQVSQEIMGKQTVVVRDTPGFIVSRMVDVIINEAACMVAEGIASPEDIDKAIKLGLAHPMGPLELADYTGGIPIVVEGMTYMMEEFGDTKYRPCYLLKQMVRAGHLGRKSGRGFYDHTKDD